MEKVLSIFLKETLNNNLTMINFDAPEMYNPKEVILKCHVI